MVSGPGGAGKGTVIRRLVEQDERLWLSRSWTTRPPRPSEDGDAYCFVSEDEFRARADAGGFLEWAEILGECYGTPLPEAPEGSDVVLEIDVQGARQVLERCEDVVCVLLVPPSSEAQAARLRARGDTEEQVAKRVALGQAEVREGRAFAAFEVTNDVLDRAVAELTAIVNDARRRFDPSQTGDPTP